MTAWSNQSTTSNDAWFKEHLSPLQKAARSWDYQRRTARGPQVGPELAEFEEWAKSHDDELEDVEMRSSRRSWCVADAQYRRDHRRSRADKGSLIVASIVSLIAIAGLIFAIKQFQRVAEEKRSAEQVEQAMQTVFLVVKRLIPTNGYDCSSIRWRSRHTRRNLDRRCSSWRNINSHLLDSYDDEEMLLDANVDREKPVGRRCSGGRGQRRAGQLPERLKMGTKCAPSLLKPHPIEVVQNVAVDPDGEALVASSGEDLVLFDLSTRGNRAGKPWSWRGHQRCSP